MEEEQRSSEEAAVVEQHQSQISVQIKWLLLLLLAGDTFLKMYV